MLPMALIGAYLNRHATLVYPAYGPPARTLGISALDDQAQAGAIMWVARRLDHGRGRAVGGGGGDGGRGAPPGSAGRAGAALRSPSAEGGRPA